ncbi:MAG: tetratricopeptide repeat protein [Desulfobacterales bacterium]|nr:tetratricopeptide repeat protein [Desulfobacterales bacterium]
MNRVRNRRVLIFIACAVALLAVLFLVLYGLDRGHVSPLWLLVLAAVFSLAAPILRANFFPSAKDCATEYDFHEKRLQQQHRQWITNAFGAEAFNRLYSDPERFHESAGEALQKMLEDTQTKENMDLRFALQVMLARVYETQGDPPKSIEHLSRALDIYPRHFIANFRLAMIYEWVEAPQEAVRHYQQALTDPGGTSRAMERLVAAQVKRIQPEPRG